MSFVVVGFYTPNYAAIASRLAQSLDHNAVPHRLYAVERLGETWQGQTLRKPEILLRAMDDNPGKVIILMDVDCCVNGPLDPLVSDADIGLHIFQKGRRRVITSSRVIAFRPTPGARRVLDLWHQKCCAAIESLQTMRVKRHELMSHKLTETDEGLLMEALFSTPNVTIRQFPGEFIGLSDGLSNRLPLISHESARKELIVKSNGARSSFVKRLLALTPWSQRKDP